jgi:hypothetical protein
MKPRLGRLGSKVTNITTLTNTIKDDFGSRYESQGTKGLSDIMKKAVLKFRTEDAEREFWASHDSTEYIDWRKGKRVTPPEPKAVVADHLDPTAKANAGALEDAG